MCSFQSCKQRFCPAFLPHQPSSMLMFAATPCQWENSTAHLLSTRPVLQVQCHCYMRSPVSLRISQSHWFWASEPPDFPCTAHHVLISGVFWLQQNLWKVDHAGYCFAWDIGKVLHSNWWNCFRNSLENSVDNRGMFLLLLTSIKTGSRLFCFSPHPIS